MTHADLQTHAKLMRRAIERHKGTEAPNPIVIAMLEMIEQEYLTAHEHVAVTE